MMEGSAESAKYQRDEKENEEKIAHELLGKVQKITSNLKDDIDK